MNLFRAVPAITALIIISPPAWAYLDPGSASLILQGFIAGILSVMAVLRLYWHRIKQFFSRDKHADTSTPANPSEPPASLKDNSNDSH